MKKKIMTLALAAAVLCGVPAFAQNTKNQQCANQTECTQGTQCQKGDKAKQGKRARGGNPYQEVFAGLNLTADQQAKLAQLDTKRQATDSVARSQRRDNRLQSRRDYLKSVKDVLTPDQYVTFLETIVVEGPAQRGQAQMQQRQRRGDGQHARLDRSQRRGDNNKSQQRQKNDKQNRGQKVNTSATVNQ